MKSFKKIIYVFFVVLIAQSLFLNCAAGNGETTIQTSHNSPDHDASIDASEFKAIELNEMDFQETISNGIVLVDFWAVWCPPCRIQGPIVQELAQDVGSWAKVAKVDVDKNPNVASQYNIRNIPTLLVFKDGQVVKRFVGLQQKGTLLAALKEFK